MREIDPIRAGHQVIHDESFSDSGGTIGMNQLTIREASTTNWPAVSGSPPLGKASH